MPGVINSPFLRKVACFAAVGAISAVVDYGSRFLLLEVGILAFTARGISYILGSTVAYYLNSFFTFQGNRSRAEKGRALVTYALCFAAAVTVDFLVRFFFPDLPYVMTIAWFVSQAATTALNFLAQNLWVFRTTDGPARAAGEPTTAVSPTTAPVVLPVRSSARQ